MTPFVTQRGRVRIVFERGASERLAAELHRLGATRVLLVCSARAADAVGRVAATLPAGSAAVFAEVRQHVPAELADSASERARAHGADTVVAWGGGSAIGLAKAIALAADVAVAAVPTTFSGSEMTPVWGMTREGVKTTGRDERVRPRLVVYDPELVRGLPRSIAVTSGINAMAHAVEALYAEGVDDATADDAERSIAALARALPRIGDGATEDQADARAEALYGAYLSGATLGAVRVALHHKLCHVLGGSFGLPHAETHTVILPHAIAFNAPAAPAAIARVARALGVDDAAAGVWDLARRLGAPTDLRVLGLTEDDLDRAAELATSRPYPNPRPVERDAVRALLADALAGRRPSAGALQCR